MILYEFFDITFHVILLERSLPVRRSWKSSCIRVKIPFDCNYLLTCTRLNRRTAWVLTESLLLEPLIRIVLFELGSITGASRLNLTRCNSSLVLRSKLGNFSWELVDHFIGKPYFIIEGKLLISVKIQSSERYCVLESSLNTLLWKLYLLWTTLRSHFFSLRRVLFLSHRLLEIWPRGLFRLRLYRCNLLNRFQIEFFLWW